MAEKKKQENIHIPEISFDDAISKMFENKKDTPFAALRKRISLNGYLVDDIQDDNEKILVQNFINSIIQEKIADEILAIKDGDIEIKLRSPIRIPELGENNTGLLMSNIRNPVLRRTLILIWQNLYTLYNKQFRDDNHS